MLVATEATVYDATDDGNEEKEPQKAESRAQYVFTEFADDESFESALGMLEQLWEDSSAEKMHCSQNDTTLR